MSDDTTVDLAAIRQGLARILARDSCWEMAGIGMDVQLACERLAQQAYRYFSNDLERGKEAAAEVDRLRAERDTLATALREALAELGGQHSGHWDPTMKHGAGCSVCIYEHEVKARLRVVLADHTKETT